MDPRLQNKIIHTSTSFNQKEVWKKIEQKNKKVVLKNPLLRVSGYLLMIIACFICFFDKHSFPTKFQPIRALTPIVNGGVSSNKSLYFTIPTSPQLSVEKTSNKSTNDSVSSIKKIINNSNTALISQTNVNPDNIETELVNLQPLPVRCPSIFLKKEKIKIDEEFVVPLQSKSAKHLQSGLLLIGTYGLYSSNKTPPLLDQNTKLKSKNEKILEQIGIQIQVRKPIFNNMFISGGIAFQSIQTRFEYESGVTLGRSFSGGTITNRKVFEYRYHNYYQSLLLEGGLHCQLQLRKFTLLPNIGIATSIIRRKDSHKYIGFHGTIPNKSYFIDDDKVSYLKGDLIVNLGTAAEYHITNLINLRFGIRFDFPINGLTNQNYNFTQNRVLSSLGLVYKY